MATRLQVVAAIVLAVVVAGAAARPSAAQDVPPSDRLEEARRAFEEAKRLYEEQQRLTAETRRLYEQALAVEPSAIGTVGRLVTNVEYDRAFGALAVAETAAPDDPAETEDRVRLRGGDDLRGEILELKGGETVRVRHKDLGEVEVPLEKVAAISFARPAGGAEAAAKGRASDSPHVVGLRDGSAIPGQVIAADGAVVALAVPFGGEPVRVPLDRLAYLSFHDQEPGDPIEGEDRLYFRGHDRLTGRFAGVGPNGSVRFEVRLGRGAGLEVPADRLCTIALARPAGAAAATPADPAGAGERVAIGRLRGGSVRGRVLGLGGGTLRIAAPWGGELAVPRGAVRRIELAGAEGAWGPLPARLHREVLAVTEVPDTYTRGISARTLALADALQVRVDSATGDVLSVLSREAFPGDRSDEGDVLHLANGDRLTGELVSASPEGVSLKTPFGVITADRKDVAAIVFRAPSRGFLGVKVEKLEAGGVTVAGVLPGSGAEQAGLKQDDVIVAVDGEPVADASDLTRLVRAHAPGDRVTLDVRRGADALKIEATLGPRP